MVHKEECFCEIRNGTVVAIVEESPTGRGRSRRITRHPIACTGVGSCPRTTFCRFVNPLTTRNPLRLPEVAAPADAAAEKTGAPLREEPSP